MAHILKSSDLPADGEHLPKGKLGIFQTVFGAIAGIGLLASIIFFIVGSGTAHGSYAFSWLFALFFCMTLAFGGVFWTLLHNLSNSGWGTSVRRLMENLGFVFPFLFLFSIPLLFPSVKQYLWEWMAIYKDAVEAQPDLGASEALIYSAAEDPHDALLAKKTFYLNPVFWHFRFFAYFIGMGLIIWRLRKLSIDQDTDLNPGTDRLFTARAKSSWGMALFAVFFSFLAIDWVMALDYSWFSTMWGVYVFSGTALTSMAVLILTAILLQKAGFLQKAVTPEHYHLMGKLLFAFVVFWAYISFSQYFLYWYANIPEETRYFILRNTGSWNLVSHILVFGHFGLPFLLLLRSDFKKKPNFMICICVYILVLHALDVYHMIIPERGPSLGLLSEAGEAKLWVGGGLAFLGDILALVIVGCGFLYFYLRNLTSAALFPHRDPRILESVNVSN